ncbi:MAG: hypothetical protein ABIR80_09245, partial [Opitutaceae bacterium]
VHYLADGNSDDALRLRVEPGVTTFYRTGSNQLRFDQTLGSGSLTTLGSFFGGRLHTSAGVSRDYFRLNTNRPPTTLAATGESQLVDLDNQPIANPTGYNVPYRPYNRSYSTNRTYGGVLRVKPWLMLAGGYFESSLFTDSLSLELSGRPRQPRTGEGTELSLRFALLENRVNATLTRFSTRPENYPVGVSSSVTSSVNALLPADARILGTNDYVDALTKGWELELQTNLSRGWTLRATYSTNRARYDRESAFPLLNDYLAVARETAQARGLSPENATRIAQQFMEQTIEGASGSVRRQTANLATRYSFTSGKFKGSAIGVSARYALGKERAALSSGGVVVLPAKRTDDYVLVNPFVSHRRRIGKIGVALQLNVNNVFGVHSDQGNSQTWPRYTEPRQYITTATVDF